MILLLLLLLPTLTLAKWPPPPKDPFYITLTHYSNQYCSGEPLTTKPKPLYQNVCLDWHNDPGAFGYISYEGSTHDKNKVIGYGNCVLSLYETKGCKYDKPKLFEVEHMENPDQYGCMHGFPTHYAKSMKLQCFE